VVLDLDDLPDELVDEQVQPVLRVVRVAVAVEFDAVLAGVGGPPLRDPLGRPALHGPEAHARLEDVADPVELGDQVVDVGVLWQRVDAVRDLVEVADEVCPFVELDGTPGGPEAVEEREGAERGRVERAGRVADERAGLRCDRQGRVVVDVTHDGSRISTGFHG
jgi:hypothetical protein